LKRKINSQNIIYEKGTANYSFDHFLSILFLPGSGFSQNIGIGTTAPAFKLDVKNGSINTDSLYRISSFPVLGIPGNGNLFVGKQAGLVNTGSLNTFAGQSAGIANSSGNFNSFFWRLCRSSEYYGRSQ
jgi:hypothetical protein